MKLVPRIFAVIFAVYSLHSAAQNYPSSTITMVVPFAAGSGTDGVAASWQQR